MGLLAAAATASAIASFVAGKPTDVACDADVNRGPVTPPPGLLVEGWTVPGSSLIHMLPSLCGSLSDRPNTRAFVRAMRVVTHEAAHAYGIRDEDCAELWAWIFAPFAYERFWGVRLFSPASFAFQARVKAETRTRPATYWPDDASCM